MGGEWLLSCIYYMKGKLQLFGGPKTVDDDEEFARNLMHSHEQYQQVSPDDWDQYRGIELVVGVFHPWLGLT